METTATLTLGLGNKVKNPPLPEDLSVLKGQSFLKERHGERTKVVLLDIGRSTVKLGVEGRKDSFTIPVSEFRKFYKQV